MLPSVLSSQRKKNISAYKNIRHDSRHNGKNGSRWATFGCVAAQNITLPLQNYLVSIHLPIFVSFRIHTGLWSYFVVVLGGTKAWPQRFYHLTILHRNCSNVICRHLFYFHQIDWKHKSLRVIRVFSFYPEIASKRFHYYGEYKITSKEEMKKKIIHDLYKQDSISLLFKFNEVIFLFKRFALQTKVSTWHIKQRNSESSALSTG